MSDASKQTSNAKTSPAGLTGLVEINEELLRDPKPVADLEQLARELNMLARVRENARLAFCRRLAAAYLLLVGHTPNRRSQDGHKFRAWCDAKIRAHFLYLVSGRKTA